MSSENVKNYTQQGGERTVIGGTLDIAPGGKVTADGAQAAAIADAAGGGTVDAEARAALNDVLAALRGIGIIASE